MLAVLWQTSIVQWKTEMSVFRRRITMSLGSCSRLIAHLLGAYQMQVEYIVSFQLAHIGKSQTSYKIVNISLVHWIPFNNWVDGLASKKGKRKNCSLHHGASICADFCRWWIWMYGQTTCTEWYNNLCLSWKTFCNKENLKWKTPGSSWVLCLRKNDA